MIATLKAVNLAASTEHTPGPWVAMGRYVFAGKDCIGICDTDNAPPARMEANARVMAAAPDLLAALKDLLGDQPFIQETGDPQAAFFHCIHCEREYGAGMDESADDCDDDCPGMIARAAIAKATGAA